MWAHSVEQRSDPLGRGRHKAAGSVEIESVEDAVVRG